MYSDLFVYLLLYPLKIPSHFSCYDGHSLAMVRAWSWRVVAIVDPRLSPLDDSLGVEDSIGLGIRPAQLAASVQRFSPP